MFAIIFIPISMIIKANFVYCQFDQAEFTSSPDSNAGSRSSQETVITSSTVQETTSSTSASTATPTSTFPWTTTRQLVTPGPVPVTHGLFTTHDTPSLVTTVHNVNETSNTSASTLELTLKACCGNRCIAFDNLMSMVGLQCCGDTPINAFEKICCSNQIHPRHAGGKYFDRCCANRPYSWDQVCCKGKVYDGVPQASCCGDLPYSIYDRSSICCADHLHKIPLNTGSAVCCGENMYDDRAAIQFCCGDQLYSRRSHNGCCHPYPGVGVEYQSIGSNTNVKNARAAAIKFSTVDQHAVQHVDGGSSQRKAEGYNSTTQLCCDRVYEKREYDFCCYVADVNAKQWIPPVPRPYSSKTHCCDGVTVLEMDQNTKTCRKR